MKFHLKRAAAVMLVTSVAIASVSGCSNKEKDTFDAAKTAITFNGEEVPAGLLQFATHYMQSQYETMYASYFGYEGVINTDVFGSGQTLGDSIKSTAVTELERLIAAEQKMGEYGVELTEEQKTAAAAAAAAFISANDAEVMAKMGATQETVERYLVLQAENVVMQEAMKADVDREVSDEEAAQRRIHYTLFSTGTEKEEAETETESELYDDVVAVEAETEPETSADLVKKEASKTGAAAETELSVETEQDVIAETETEEPETEDPETAAAKERAYNKAMAMIHLVKSGVDFEAASAQISESAYTNTITFGEDDESTRKELIEATNGLPDGTLVETPVEVSTGYYVVYLDTQLDREATDARKEEIIQERENARVEELYTQWIDEADLTVDEEVLAAIVFDYSLRMNMETEAAEAETDAAEAQTDLAEAQTDLVEVQTELVETQTELVIDDVEAETEPLT